MLYKCFDKKTGSGLTSKATTNVNGVLAQEFHKPGKVSRFKDNIWAAILAEMGLISERLFKRLIEVSNICFV